MIATYFLQKIRKYALPLLVLQSVIIIGLVIYFNFKSVECQEEKEVLTSVITQSQKHCNTCVDSSTKSIVDTMSEEVWQEGKGNEFVECAVEIQRITNEVIETINRRFTSESLIENDLEVQGSIQKHYMLTLKSFEELNVRMNRKVIDFDDMNTVEAIYLKIHEADSQALYEHYLDIKTENSYLAYAAKLRNDLRRIERNLVVLLWGKIPISSCNYAQFHVEVNAPKLIEQGDTVNAVIFLAESIPVQGKLMIGKDIIAEGRLEGETHQVIADRLGKHQIEGALITKGELGQTKTYSFSHEYKVIPKLK